ncbi:MAG: 16S rRNA (adenine(1518)-N(6)/adenine(1519)-N(6))-dimethyltransferase RsmA [Verrucomicrobiota bacterium]
MNLSEIKAVLNRQKIQLSKSLGQNFLHDHHQLQRIVGQAEVSSADQILEIGPGLGALTHLLLEKNPHWLALETDQRLFDSLRNSLGNKERLHLQNEDALDYLRRSQTDWSNWKVVSNLPYSVASPILVELAQLARPPALIVVTLQLEVAERLMAQAGDDAYGVLSLLVQVRYEPRASFKIPASCFFPIPGVDSACVTLGRRSSLLLGLEQLRPFTKIVKRAFSQRRKMMMKLLKADWPLSRLTEAFAATGIGAQARAETVTLEQFVELTRLLTL